MQRHIWSKACLNTLPLHIGLKRGHSTSKNEVIYQRKQNFASIISPQTMILKCFANKYINIKLTEMKSEIIAQMRNKVKCWMDKNRRIYKNLWFLGKGT